MFAIYFTDPKTGSRYACTSSGHRCFWEAPTPPALFAQEKNAKKVFRDWRKRDAEALAGRWSPGEAYFVRLDGRTQITFEGSDDYANYSVVPMVLTPDWDNAIPSE